MKRKIRILTNNCQEYNKVRFALEKYFGLFKFDGWDDVGNYGFTIFEDKQIVDGSFDISKRKHEYSAIVQANDFINSGQKLLQ